MPPRYGRKNDSVSINLLDSTAALGQSSYLFNLFRLAVIIIFSLKRMI